MSLSHLGQYFHPRQAAGQKPLMSLVSDTQGRHGIVLRYPEQAWPDYRPDSPTISVFTDVILVPSGCWYRPWSSGCRSKSNAISSLAHDFWFYDLCLHWHYLYVALCIVEHVFYNAKANWQVTLTSLSVPLRRQLKSGHCKKTDAQYVQQHLRGNLKV